MTGIPTMFADFLDITDLLALITIADAENSIRDKFKI
jgi:hypothetical protein